MPGAYHVGPNGLSNIQVNFKLIINCLLVFLSAVKCTENKQMLMFVLVSTVLTILLVSEVQEAGGENGQQSVFRFRNLFFFLGTIIQHALWLMKYYTTIHDTNR